MKNTKYVCIVKKWYPVDEEGPKPKYNEVVTKTREIPSMVLPNKLMYLLKEYPGQIWDSNAFVPVVDKDISISIVDEVPDKIEILNPV